MAIAIPFSFNTAILNELREHQLDKYGKSLSHATRETSFFAICAVPSAAQMAMDRSQAKTLFCKSLSLPVCVTLYKNVSALRREAAKGALDVGTLCANAKVSVMREFYNSRNPFAP